MSYLTDHAADLFGRSEYEFTATGFLSPAEQLEIFDALPAAGDRLVFWGGALFCERRCAFFVPEWMLDSARGETGNSSDQSNDSYGECAFLFPRRLSPLGAFSEEREAAAAVLDRDGSLSKDLLRVVHIEGSDFVDLAHRDYMGAVLNLGIKREMLGDIVVLDAHSADAYCTKRAAQIISSDLERIGRDGVRVTVRTADAFERIERKYEIIMITVASLRLDCIVGEIANQSREGAKRLIASGAVELDHREVTESDRRVCEGDVLSVRGKGKFRIGAVTGVTRKDRLRLTIQRYV